MTPVLLANFVVLSCDVLTQAYAGRQVLVHGSTVGDTLGETVLSFLLSLVEGGYLVLHVR